MKTPFAAPLSSPTHAPASLEAGNDIHGADSAVWNLARIYREIGDLAVAADEKAAAELVTRLQEHRGTLSRPDVTAEHLLLVIEEYERLQTIAQRLRAFGRLHAAVDHGDARKTRLQARMDEAVQRWSAELLFIEVEIRLLPEEKLAVLVDDPQLQPYRQFIERQRAQARYTLSEPEERAIAKKDIAGKHALVRFREEFAAKMDFGRFTIDGEERAVTESDLSALRYHADPQVREQARLRIFETYRRHLDVYTFVYTGIVKDHAIECEMRGYSRAMDAENVPTRSMAPSLTR